MSVNVVALTVKRGDRFVALGMVGTVRVTGVEHVGDEWFVRWANGDTLGTFHARGDDGTFAVDGCVLWTS